MSAIENTIREWARIDAVKGVKLGRDGSLDQITGEMLGREVDKLGLDQEKADELRVELMEIYTDEMRK